jgi:Tfp pilus assembly protein PilF
MTTGHASAEFVTRRVQLERVLAASPGDPELLIEYGALLFEPFHETEKSISALERAAALSPQDTRPLFWLAKIAVHRELDDTKARALLKRALLIDPACAECLALLISVLSADRSELTRSAALAEELTRVAPDWPRSHEIRAQIAAALGRAEEAREEYLEALRLSEQLQQGGVRWSYFDEAVTGRYVTTDSIKRIEAALAGLSGAHPQSI